MLLTGFITFQIAIVTATSTTGTSFTFRVGPNIIDLGGTNGGRSRAHFAFQNPTFGDRQTCISIFRHDAIGGTAIRRVIVSVVYPQAAHSGLVLLIVWMLLLHERREFFNRGKFLFVL
jgi:hypothetical protein